MSVFFWTKPHNANLTFSVPSSLQQAAISAPTSSPLPPTYPFSDDYAWRSGTPKYFTISAMKRCLAKQTIYFVGESHMRYQFDITMDRYVNKQRVGRYHGAMNVSGISYADMTFSARMAKFIDKIECSSNTNSMASPSTTTYVLQTGSWDLQFFPPRGFIESPYQANALLRALSRLAERASKCRDPDEIRVLWMSTMPHPWCKPQEDHCQRLMNYWRNNGAIRAANQYMENELSKLHFKNLVLLDAPNILLPRFPFAEEFVCVDHFMCNNPPRGLVTTPGGMALANEVLLIACSFTESDSTQNMPPSSSSSFFRDGQRLKGGTSAAPSFFTVEQGCRRQIPDMATLASMGLPESTFTEVSDAILNDIPICFRPSYPSRQTRTLLQPYNSKRVYFIDGGYKRPLKGAHVLTEFGLDFDNVTFVLEEDFDVIPMGQPLGGKSECTSC